MIGVRNIIASSAEALVRAFFWILIGYFVEPHWVSCASYPEAGAPRPFNANLVIFATPAVALLSAPIFIAAVLLLRRFISDIAIRVFLAGCAPQLGQLLLLDYIEGSGDPCSNSIWSGWAWWPAVSVGGAAALLAHWLVYRPASAFLRVAVDLFGAARPASDDVHRN